MAVIQQNHRWALLYNLAAMPLAALGLVPPWLAALGMSFSSLCVIGNALRIGRKGSTVTAPAPPPLHATPRAA
jgi:Cu2+-exporting ATPase